MKRIMTNERIVKIMTNDQIPMTKEEDNDQTKKADA